MAKVHIYGCGGMGTNVVSIYRNAEQEPNMPELAVSFIDTSLSNLSKHGISESEACVLDGLDGSGKLRKENATSMSFLPEPISRLAAAHCTSWNRKPVMAPACRSIFCCTRWRRSMGSARSASSCRAPEPMAALGSRR